MKELEKKEERDMSDSQEKVFDLIFGRWRSQILYAGVKLGIFDALRAGPKTATLTAHELGLDSTLAYRLMRALGSLELLREGEDRTFSLTEAGELLRSDHPQTLRGITLLEEGPEHYALWKHLPAMVQDGKQNAFMREFGRMAFNHAVQDAGYAQVFDNAMSSYSSAQAEWVLNALRTYDFSKIMHLCDVGGGHGYMLSRLLAQYPRLKGTVLERAEVIADTARLWASKLGVGDRCQYMAGDMFKAAPAADAYMMKLILHDWNDSECIQILENQRKAATPGGRVFIVEHVIPDPGTPHFAKLFDIHMMCWGTGRERTQEEYAALLDKAGWKYVATWFPPSRAMGVVEGAKL
jgi:O-methyltransferase domain/Dimerisation domain